MKPVFNDEAAKELFNGSLIFTMLKQSLLVFLITFGMKLV